MNVPSAVAIAVEISAISTELVSAFARSGSANGCCPVAQGEALPGEVEAALVVVEREQDDDEDRDEQVQQREHRPDAERPVAQAVARTGRRAAGRRRSTGGGAGGFDDGHQIAASVRFCAPSRRA